MLELLNQLQPRLLQGLAPDEVSAFSRVCTKKTYPDGTKLFNEGSEARILYILVEGLVDLCFELPGNRNPGVIVTIENPGDAVGFSAITEPYKYHSSGYCKKQVTIVEIVRENLSALFETNYHIAFILMRNIAGIISQRLFQFQHQLSKKLGEDVINGW